MAKPPQQDDKAAPSAPAEIKKAHERAITTTRNCLTSKTKGNPAVDQADLLRQQVTLYPRLRDGLVQAARWRVTAYAPKEEPTGKDSSAAERHGLLVGGDVEITHTLDARILEWPVEYAVDSLLSRWLVGS